MILPSPVQQYSSPFESYLSNQFTILHALHGPWQVFIKCMYFFIAFLYCTRIRLEDNENMNQNVTQTPELCSNPMLSTTELHLHILLFWNIRVQSVLEKYSVIVCNSFLQFFCDVKIFSFILFYFLAFKTQIQSIADF